MDEQNTARIDMPSDGNLEDTYYTLEEVAKILRVSQRTVYRWIKEGHLTAIQVMKRGGHRILKRELDKFYAKSAVSI